MEKPNFYSILIPDIRYNRKLTWFDKVLYSEISALTNVKGFCYARNIYFEKVFNISTSTVTRSIKRLEDNNFIKTELEIDEKTKSILYRKIFLTPMVKNDHTPIIKNDYTRARNHAFKNNNTSNDYKTKYNQAKSDVNIPWLKKYL